MNEIGSAFVCAQNMTLEAYDLGVSSVIVGRAEATFTQPAMQEYLDKWGLDSDYIPLVFVCLGYINGPYPAVKARTKAAPSILERSKNKWLSNRFQYFRKTSQASWRK